MDDNKVAVVGLLYSQIGYDLRDTKRAMVRDDGHALTDVRFLVARYRTLKPVLNKKAEYWGEKWGSHWWVLDFTELEEKG